ncbi:unnamed protein product [Rotaria magnacalcarata]|uniref:Tubulin-tyrosine ligase n=2 Tax=Rotaria magnacalcarata TaxID=392030 RepID=A0A816P9M1_9BILA|nr:unnamed protein product [Rotaria magnacalcarata]CAF1462772.1 unnamed protein product [Rotaria magnacalcarata]CAF1940750.1 unnamed protein product [Rotaria magnacalcarata]CAF2046055.1 unnamed protein product [Rotaria magnacalcarata]CAF2226459.1 unnamed protein product [Rotaria magnacalcarata]
MNIKVHLKMNCPYTNELIRNVLEERNDLFTLTDSSTSNDDNTLYWLEYEELDFDMLYRLTKESNNKKFLANSYCIRKGLLRKANFAMFVRKHLAKQPNSVLRDHYPETHIVDLIHPDYLDEALNEAFELRDTLEANTQENTDPIPFILKASILDKASELLIFYTQSELEEFFTRKYDDDDDESIANVREWIVQRYIKNPKLLPIYQNRKFHLRVYVVAERNLRIYVYDGILALFASLCYADDNDQTFDRLRHITNTCVQIDSKLDEEDLVKEFFSLENMDDELRSNIFEQIKSIVKDIFTGLHNEITVFQPIRNAFEIYGFDFLIDENNQVYFLEANAFPDFKQTGNSLSILIKELFQNLVQHIVLPYFGYEESNEITQRKLHLVYEKQKTL